MHVKLNARDFRRFGFGRFPRLRYFVLVVPVVSPLSVVSFWWFRFVVSDFSTCPSNVWGFQDKVEAAIIKRCCLFSHSQDKQLTIVLVI